MPMNLSVNGFNSFSIFLQKFGTAGMLKSTQDKIERQQKEQSQIEFSESMEDVMEITDVMEEKLTIENVELLDETTAEESEVLAEKGLLPQEEIKYKKIDILI